MKAFAYLRSLVATLFRSRQVDHELDEELRSHLELRADDLERSSSLPRAEAERRARIEFGGYEHFREESHEQLPGHFAETLLQDIRFAFRIFRKSPGFTAIAILTVAVGIGANAVVFSVMNALVLRPLNLPRANDLYMVERGKDNSEQHSYPDYLDLRDRTRSFEGVIAYSIDRAGLDTGGHPVSSWIYLASGNYFDALGIQPYLGRFFHESDEHGPNSSPYIVLSYAYWHDHFAADPNVVGRSVQLNKFPYTVIGVAPLNLRGTELYYAPDFWTPLVNEEQVEGASELNARDAHGLWVIARAKPGVTTAQMAADLDSVAAYLRANYPKQDDATSFSLTRPGLAGDMLGQPVRAFLAGMMALAGLILLAVCANLGSLFAARASDRAGEIALRLALGSSRRRVLRQLFTESLLISLIGGAFGVLVGVFLLRWLSIWRPVPDIPINVPVNPDFGVYGFALLLALVSGFLFGVIPVRQVLRANPYQIVKSGLTYDVGRRFAPRDILLVVQVAACAVLVTASLVAVKGLVRSLHSNFGFQPQNILLVDTDLDMAGYKGDSVPPMQRRMLDAVRTIPGVSSAALADRLPLSLGWNTNVIFTDDTTDFRTSNAAAESTMFNISPDYFHTANTSLLSGRDVTWRDDANAPHVAVVNREFVKKVLGSTDGAVGRYFKMDGKRVEVVGIVEDGKYKTLTEDPQPAAFLPILQSPTSSTVLVIRSEQDPQALAADVNRKLRTLDESMPFTLRTWPRELDSALFASRVATVALGVLGGLGVLLAGTGIFGVAAYSVSKRLRELGIRIAMGAQRAQVVWTALSRALVLLAIGSALGVLLGLAGTGLLSYVVYQATPRDPVVLAGVVVTMVLLGALATWLPAYRALKADPLVLLREQ